MHKEDDDTVPYPLSLEEELLMECTDEKNIHLCKSTNFQLVYLMCTPTVGRYVQGEHNNTFVFTCDDDDPNGGQLFYTFETNKTTCANCKRLIRSEKPTVREIPAQKP